ncbi:MAG: DinB family protein [Thermoplasmata archaeon]
MALPKRWRAPKPIELRVLLVHMIEEELQHRGEMNALLWQSGRNPPVTGYDD